MTEPNIEEAVGFLQVLRPDGPWLLVAIKPDGAAIGQTCTTEREVKDFISAHDGRRNIYFSVCPTRRVINKKASKEDIAASDFVWTEIDPELPETEQPDDSFRARAAAEISKQKQQALARLRAFTPLPTLITDSGNGLQAFWRLLQRHDITNPESIAAIECRNKWLLQQLGGDPSAWNIDRILRLPGTTNLPSAKKRKQGKVEITTKLIELNEDAYPLEAFTIATETTSKEKTTADAKPLDATEAIEPSDLRLSALEKKWIKLGHEGDGITLKYGGDRSRALFAFVCECLRAGIDQAVIVSCVMHWTIGAHVRDQSNVKRALDRLLRRAIEFVEDSKLFEMNEQHCVLPIGGKTRVATWGDDPEFRGYRTITRFSSVGDFKALHDKYRHEYQDSGGETQSAKLGAWWVGHPHRRQYDGGMRFVPTCDDEVIGQNPEPVAWIQRPCP